ncbi:MAG: DUF1801 domain-containing protein [Gemmatimonadaceae bacterium]
MAKAALKTKPTKVSVSSFLAKQEKERRRECETVAKIMKTATGAQPRMWGPSIVGFGTYHYSYASGREGEWMVTGFSPRKSDLTLYLMPSVNTFPSLLKRLGKHKTGKSCLYIRKLDDVDIDVLTELVKQSVARMADKRTDR